LLNTSWSSGLNYRILSGWAGGIGAALSEALPIYAPFKADGTYDVSHPNPLVPIKENIFRSDDKRLLGGLSLIFSPIKNLDLKVTGNIDNYKNITDQFNNAKITNPTANNSAERWKTRVNNFNFNGVATYNYTLNSSHSFTFLLGTEYQKSVTKTINYYQSDSTTIGPFYKNTGLLDKAFVNYINNFPGISKSDSMRADIWTFLSYFARINYNYRNKLFLQLLARIDGSSKFGP